MAQTPSRTRITLPVQLLLEVAGSGVQQKIADIELPIVILVGTDEQDAAPTVQDTPLERGPAVMLGGDTLMSARDLLPGAEGNLVNQDGSLGAAVRGQADGTWTKVEQPESVWHTSSKQGQCPNRRMHSAHLWGQIEGTPTDEEILSRQVKVTHYHCPGA